MNQQEIRMRELEIAVEANQTLLTLETQKAKRAMHQILAIGHELGGVDFGTYLESHSNQDMSPEEAAVTIIGIVKAHLALLKNIPDSNNVAHLNRQLEETRSLLDSQTKRAEQAEENLRVLSKQVNALETAQADLRQKNQKLDAAVVASQSPAPAQAPTEWLEAWQKEKNFKRASRTLQLIGETGWARESQIKEEGAKRFYMDPKSIERGVNDLNNAWLIECEPDASTGGHPTNILWLNEKGRWAYKTLFQKEPVPSEYGALLKAHKSKRQVALVLKAGDLFSLLGYAVAKDKAEIKIDENRYFEPDLILSKDGQTYYVEVETGIGPNRAPLDHKWNNAATVGGNRIYLVTGNNATMVAVSSNIVNWATQHGRKVHIYATHLEALKKKVPGESPWLIDKDR